MSSNNNNNAMRNTYYTQINQVTLNCNGTQVSLRQMLSSDYDKVRHLISDVTRCNLVHKKEDVELLLSLQIYHPVCCFIENTEELVGFAELYRLPHMGRSFDARLERVIVADSFRKNKLATLMCQHIIKEAKVALNCNKIVLQVENDIAKHIYKRLGFQYVKTNTMYLNL